MFNAIEEDFRKCPEEIVDINDDCIKIGHMWTWLPKNDSLCMRCGIRRNCLNQCHINHFRDATK